MKKWTLVLLLPLCIGCGESSRIVGKWRPVDADGKSGSTKIEFFNNKKCRFDLTGQLYDWSLSGRQLVLVRPKGSGIVRAAVDFPDAEHMEYSPLDEDTGHELHPQKLERVDE